MGALTASLKSVCPPLTLLQKERTRLEIEIVLYLEHSAPAEAKGDDSSIDCDLNYV